MRNWRKKCLFWSALIGVTLALNEGQLVVWDIDSVPDFRDATPSEDAVSNEAIAGLLTALADGSATNDRRQIRQGCGGGRRSCRPLCMNGENASHGESAIELLHDLVAIPSTSANEAEAVDF